MSVVMILTHPCVVYFSTEFKEDRYRVTINRVIWYPQVAVTTYNVTQGVGAMDLNDLALKKGNTFRSSFCKSISEHLNRIFTYMFTYHKVHEEQNDDWQILKIPGFKTIQGFLHLFHANRQRGVGQTYTLTWVYVQR